MWRAMATMMGAPMTVAAQLLMLSIFTRRTAKDSGPSYRGPLASPSSGWEEGLLLLLLLLEAATTEEALDDDKSSSGDDDDDDDDDEDDANDRSNEDPRGKSER